MAQPYLPPPIESATDPVHSTADLRRRWQALMGPLGFGERLLWFSFVGPDRCLITVLNQIDIPLSPDERIGVEVFSMLRAVLDGFEPDTTVALLLTRPGTGPVSNADRRWVRCSPKPLSALIFRWNRFSARTVQPSCMLSPTDGSDVKRASAHYGNPARRVGRGHARSRKRVRGPSGQVAVDR